VISESVSLTTTRNTCPISNVVVLGTKPSGSIPYSESASNITTIIENSHPSVFIFEWSLYVAKCSQLYLYAVTPNIAKGGITPVKICTCGLETISAVTSDTLELLYLIGTEPSS
jgi:hypothetical protein